MKTYKTQEVSYDVSGGDSAFDSFAYQGIDYLAVQLFYTSLSQADGKLRLQESIDGVNFVDAEDSSGNAIEITINNALTNDILSVKSFNAAFIRFKFIEGTAGTGTIDTLRIVME